MQGGGNKNPPWARGGVGGVGSAGHEAHGGYGMPYGAGVGGVGGVGGVHGAGGMMPGMAGMYGSGMSGMNTGMSGMNSGVVAYPTPRNMAPQPFQQHQQQQQHHQPEQRVFTGTVTKTHNDFGFVDQDVFYQTSVCSKGIIPKVSDRVLVEATYNANMPFKWNATRVQVLNNTANNKPAPNKQGSGYNAVPPPIRGDNRKQMNNNRREDRPLRREPLPKRPRSRSPLPARSKSPCRPKRRESPPRKRRAPTPPKYAVRMPRIPLDITEADVTSMTQRYSNMYIPSDFFSSCIRWSETFPPQYPFSLNNPSNFYIMSKDVEQPNTNDAVLEPPDADYRFSAKVMLISLPTLEALYQKCGLTKGDPKEKRDSKVPLHPTRLIKFLVGRKDKGSDNFAIGGPWSPSLDGPDPDKDPAVLVKTAIRTTKALTGIDLSPCTQWFRMVEFYYWRESSGDQKSRLECVVLFLPDVWTAVPSRADWTLMQETYKKACDDKIKILNGETPQPEAEETIIEVKDDTADASELNDSATSELSESKEGEPEKEPTHYSKIDLRTIKVDQLREELQARSLSSRGLRAQLIARLSKCLKNEEENEKKGDSEMEVEKEEEKDKEPEVIEIKEDSKDKKKEDKEKCDPEKSEVITEKDTSNLKSQYLLPTSPHLLVHPSPTARGGKFNCNLTTLSVLLDYRVTDNKEHSFEIFVFAELFNEMLMRDFGFYIYKTLYTLPERREEEDKKDKKKEEKEDKKKEEKEEKDDKVDKKDKDREVDKEKEGDKEKKEVDKERKRDRKDSGSENESEKRAGSPGKKKVSRGVELPPDPYLLLALYYFDTSRCGYINKRDLQTLFMSLGLQLSRSQLRHLLDRACVKEILSYKRLAEQIKDLSTGTGGSSDALQDLPLDSTVQLTAVPPNIADLEATIAAGNRDLLPVFDDGSDAGPKRTKGDVSDTGMIMYKNRLVDIGAMLAALSRSEQERSKLEVAVQQARSVTKTLRTTTTTHQALIKNLQTQLTDVNHKLSLTKARLFAVTASSKIFHAALKTIQMKVESVVNINLDDDQDVEIVNGPTKLDTSESRPVKEEKIPKKEIKSDPTDNKKEDTIKEEKPDLTSEFNDEIKAVDDESKDVLQPENMDLDDKE